jgi:hypothetical protein
LATDCSRTTSQDERDEYSLAIFSSNDIKS